MMLDLRSERTLTMHLKYQDMKYAGFCFFFLKATNAPPHLDALTSQCALLPLLLFLEEDLDCLLGTVFDLTNVEMAIYLTTLLTY